MGVAALADVEDVLFADALHLHVVSLGEVQVRVKFKPLLGLFGDEDVIVIALRAHSASLVHVIADERELRFVLAYDSGDDVTRVNADLNLDGLPILEGLLPDVAEHVLGELDHSQRVMVVD